MVYPWKAPPLVANQIDLFMHFLGASRDGLVARLVEMDKLSSSVKRMLALQFNWLPLALLWYFLALDSHALPHGSYQQIVRIGEMEHGACNYALVQLFRVTTPSTSIGKYLREVLCRLVHISYLETLTSALLWGSCAAPVMRIIVLWK